MKALFLSVAVALTGLSFAARAATTEELLAQARKAYSEREYSAAGIQHAQEAADLYGQLATQTTDAKAKAKYLVGQAEAFYFVGNANASSNVKIEKHLKGMEAADQAAKLLGVADVTKVSDADVERLKTSLSAEDLLLLAEALYQRGTNLGQWGAANGVTSSLGKWPELRSTMNLIINLGQKDLNEYGPYRVLGRGYYKIPALLGGDMKKADKYLSTALSKTQVAGQPYSTNGFNTTYYADVLKENGETQKAKDLLAAFIKADPATLNPNLVPENKQAQKDAAELLKNW